ncbi:MAG: protein translocase subunit SecD [Chloroflexi bacterium]|nr:protein translocase subunit SecD [Chloroflexota bacterium]
MYRHNGRILIGLILIALLALLVAWPQKPSNYLPGILPWPERGWIEFTLGDSRFVRQGMRLGLDLQGGTHLVYEADLSKTDARERDNSMRGVVNIIERRVNAYGVAEPVIQRQGTNRVSIQLPGVRNIQEAIKLIGATAQLDFREPELDATGNVVYDAGKIKWKGVAKGIGSDGQEKELTGLFFKPNAQVVIDPQTSKPEVAFEFDSEGAKLFEQITGRLVQKPLGIFLDDQVISAPTVQSVIRERGRITGLSIEEARPLAIQLNAGALPVPIHVVQQEDVDATLGADSIKKSILAGEIGLALVGLFMILYYRGPGVLATFALLIYAIIVLAIFKLIPVTLTLGGIAAFILSVGMAVDANILIFERMKEESWAGKTLGAAIEAGFDRAWSSIRDSNVSTFITCAILYWFGSNFGASLVMGFALTLFIGVAVSMFSAIFVTRTLLRAVVGTGLAKNTVLFKSRLEKK